MRWSWVFAIAMATSSTANARTDGRHPVTPVRTNVDFWKDIVDPNAEEVGVILGKVRELVQRPDQGFLNNDTDWAVDHRTRFYRDARNMLVYARKLNPQHVEVLALLGRVSDELGDTKAAVEALEACVRVTGPDKVPIDVASRLGAIQIRLGDLDAGIKWLRVAQVPLSITSAPAIVNLANALAIKGDSAKAIDTLANAIPPSMLGSLSDITLATFALAVLYDRDEQRASAFAVLDQMQSSLQQQYASSVQTELVKFRFPAAEDLHYYRGLLYESLGQYVEARAEWAIYAAAGTTPWRARALDHIAAIDAQRRANPGAPPQPATLNPAVPTPRRIRRHP